MIQRKTYTNNLSPTSCMKLGDEKRFSNSSDLKKYFTQNNMETNEADIINGKSSLKKIKNKLIFSIFLMMSFLVNAQNIEVRAYNDQNFTVKADTFTGSGYATVNGGSTSSQVTQASISTMPSSVSGYAGVHVVVYSQWIGTLPTSAQFDALVEFIRQGGVVIANVEREGTTFREILDRLMGTSHGITKTLAGTAGISPVNFVHPGEGTLKLRTVTNTSTPTTTSYSTFAGVPSAARILHGTSNSGCNGTCLDFVVPTFPGVATTLNGQTVRGMLIMSGEVQGPLTGGGSVRSLAMDQSYAKLIYDFYNSPSAMVSRRAWSATSTNQNPICVPATFVEPCSTTPTLSGTTITNTCPTTTVNLNSLHTGTAPTGSTLVWFTNNAHTGTAYATPTAAVAGTYYAFYYDAANNCYSPVSNAVTATINTCPAVCTGTSVPATGSNTYNGVLVTPTLSGNATTYATIYTDCGITTAVGAAWLNNTTSTANTGTVTYTFSKPVNNVVVRFNATSFSSSPAEVITITTNNGTVTTTAAVLCGVTKSGNTFTGTGVNGGAEITVTSTLPYTSLTVNDTGNNQNNGTIVELCSASIVPATIPCTGPAPGIQ